MCCCLQQYLKWNEPSVFTIHCKESGNCLVCPFFTQKGTENKKENLELLNLTALDVDFHLTCPLQLCSRYIGSRKKYKITSYSYSLTSGSVKDNKLKGIFPVTNYKPYMVQGKRRERRKSLAIYFRCDIRSESTEMTTNECLGKPRFRSSKDVFTRFLFLSLQLNLFRVEGEEVF